MAQPCPCGCGRQLGWSGSRVAKNAVQMLQRIPAAHRVSKLFDAWHETNAEQLRRFVDVGQEYIYFVLDDAHGDKSARAFMPSVSQVMHWCRQANELTSTLPALDPEWSDWWQNLGCPPADPSLMSSSTIRFGQTWDGELRVPPGVTAPPPPPVPAKPS